MSHSNLPKPVWAWVVLIGGGLLLLSSFPSIVLTIVVPLRQSHSIGMFSVLYIAIALGIFIGTIWAMKRAFHALKTYQRAKQYPQSIIIEETVSSEHAVDAHAKKKPIWPWIVILAGLLPLIGSGPGVIMIPIMPLFLAGMSTDSGDVPNYVPFLIIVIGYGLLIGYLILLIKAIQVLKRNND